MSWSNLYPIKFESDQDHCLDTKKVKVLDFSIYLSLNHFKNHTCLDGGMHSPSALDTIAYRMYQEPFVWSFQYKILNTTHSSSYNSAKI